MEDQIWAHKVTYHPEIVEDKSTTHNPDFRVGLPNTVEKIGLGRGSCIRLTNNADSDPPHILVEKLDRDPPCSPDYKIYETGPLRMTLPSDYVDEYLERAGSELLIVEVNTLEENIRVFKNQDYQDKRIGQVKEEHRVTPIAGKPVILPLATASVAEPLSSSEKILSKNTGVTQKSQSLREGFGDDIDDAGK